MTRQLEALGVALSQPPRYVPAPRATCSSHQPWLGLPWTALPTAARIFPPGLRLSQCLIDRLGGGAIAGLPGTLPGPYVPDNLSAYLNGVLPAPGVAVA